MEALVSVILPAYNHEQYIQESIQSVIDQTYKNIELIIIDDGSTDKTLEKIKQIQSICEERFVRFVLIPQDNQGICKTLNKLIELSQGEYVQMLASDDRLFPDTVEVLYNFLSKNSDYGLAVGDNIIIDADGQQCYWDIQRNNVYNIDEAVYITFGDFLIKTKNYVNFLSDEFGSYETLLKENYIPNGSMIRKSIIEKIGRFSKEAPLEDYYLMLQVAKYSKMKYFNKPLFSYRWHGCNTIMQIEKMQRYTNMTLLYEFKNIANFKDPCVQMTLLKHINKVLNTRYFKEKKL